MYEAFFNSSDDILFITDNEGHLLNVNTSYCHKLGYNKSQVLSRDLIEFLYPDDADKTLSTLSELSVTESVNLQYRYIDSHGQFLKLNCTVYKDDETGNILSVAQIMSDKILSDNFNNTNAHITKLVKDTAHEINNPLGIISGYTELIKSQSGLDASINEKLDVILNSCERIANTIQNLKQDYCSDGRQ